ncbi:MAG TPA: hypothetical protein DIU15_21015 [Deltaproteobacteria bacterium]|nr:hypothetical protein [Deltaproteobacteria bacterium]
MKPSYLVSLLVAVVLLLPLSGLAGKRHKVKTSIELEAAAPLVLQVDAKELQRVRGSNWPCLLKLFSASGAHKELHRIDVQKDGSWIAYKEEAKDAEEEGDDDDSAGDDDDSAGDDDDSADWKSKEVLTLKERLERRGKKSLGKFTVEVSRGEAVMVKAEKENASGEASKDASAESTMTIVLPSELLPKGTFDVGSGGYFGISLGGVKIGSPSMTGVVRVRR